MDRLWTPWRYSFVSRGKSGEGCIFCEKAAENRDAENYIVHRGRRNFVLLNLYPYTNGHLMVAPYAHVASLVEADPADLEEMIALARTAEGHLRALYRPDGLNLGINLGESAGAGIAGHLHLHVLPRWTGDAGFISTVGETRLLPETLEISYRRLREAWNGS